MRWSGSPTTLQPRRVSGRSSRGDPRAFEDRVLDLCPPAPTQSSSGSARRRVSAPSSRATSRFAVTGHCDPSSSLATAGGARARRCDGVRGSDAGVATAWSSGSGRRVPRRRSPRTRRVWWRTGRRSPRCVVDRACALPAADGDPPNSSRSSRTRRPRHDMWPRRSTSSSALRARHHAHARRPLDRRFPARAEFRHRFVSAAGHARRRPPPHSGARRRVSSRRRRRRPSG